MSIIITMLSPLLLNEFSLAFYTKLSTLTHKYYAQQGYDLNLAQVL